MQIENGRFYFINNTFIQKYGIKYRKKTENTP